MCSQVCGLLSCLLILSLLSMLQRPHLLTMLDLIFSLLLERSLYLVIVHVDQMLSMKLVVCVHLLHMQLLLQDLFLLICSFLLIFEEHLDTLTMSFDVLFERSSLVIFIHHSQGRAHRGHLFHWTL